MLPPEFEALNKAVASAGARIMHYFGQQLAFTQKSTKADIRTRADVEAEEIIIDAIEQLFPAYNILAEEQGEKRKDSPFTFIIDPLDGTNNFVLGIPAFTSSVALMKDQDIIYGVISHPVTGDLYYTAKGKGAFKNGTAISVNAEAALPDATVSYYCDYTAPRPRTVAFKTTLLNLALKRYLDLWSPAFCYCGLADGRLEAIINDGIELYDFAAGKLLAVEAGATVTDLEGRPVEKDTHDTFLITNGTALHEVLVDTVTRPLSHAS